MRSKVSGTSRAGALLWLFCFQFLIAEQIARLHVAGPYSMARNYISDLGATQCFDVSAAGESCSRLHWLMNASFTLQGLLIFFGAIFLRRLVPPGMLSRAALLVFAASGVGVFLVGLNPEDVNAQLHLQGATLHFVGGAVAMLLMGVALLRRSSASRLGGSLSLIAGAIALSATLLLGYRGSFAWNALGWSVGTVERVAAYPLPIWLTCAGFLWLRSFRIAAVGKSRTASI